MVILQILKTSSGAMWAYQQTKWLCEHGIDIVTVMPDFDGSTYNKYIESGLKVIKGDFSLPLTSPWKYFSRIREIKKIVKEINPDIIHMHFVTNVLMVRLALKGKKIKRIFQVPGPLHLESFVVKMVEIGLSDKYDYWIGTCRKTCDIYNKSNLSERVFLGYYGGYGGKECDNYDENKNIIHKQYSIPSNCKLVGMISYFYKPKKYLLKKSGIKGHEDFIDALSIVRQNNSDVVGIIVGDAWKGAEKYTQSVKDYAQKVCPDGIIFTGFRNDIKHIYKEFDLVVHPSHSENLGGAAESLAAGVPTISTDIGGFPDIVKNGVTGYTVPVNNPEKLSEMISVSLNDYEHSVDMALEGKKYVQELLDIEVCAKNISEIYDKILNEM